MARWFALMMLTALLTACEVLGGGTPVATLERPDLAIIDWERSASTVVFRAEVAGGLSETAFVNRNDVPYCTVYGDNRVVWTTSGNRADDTVVWDIVSDDTIRTFVETLTVGFGYYSYRSGAELITPMPEAPLPVYDRLTLFVNGEAHQIDSLGGFDFDFFEKILQICTTLSTTPVLFEPTAAWVSAQRTDYNPSLPSHSWDIAQLNLAELADSGERRWITATAEDRSVIDLWTLLHTWGADAQFETQGGTFHVAVEVPNVTRFSPPGQ